MLGNKSCTPIMRILQNISSKKIYLLKITYYNIIKKMWREEKFKKKIIMLKLQNSPKTLRTRRKLNLQ